MMNQSDKFDEGDQDSTLLKSLRFAHAQSFCNGFKLSGSKNPVMSLIKFVIIYYFPNLWWNIWI